MAEYVAESKPAIINQDARSSARIALVGVAVGLTVWALTMLLERVVLRAVFCSDEAAAACVNVSTYAGNIAAVIVAIAGVVALVKLNVYRPLLIALGAAVSLWGLAAWTESLHFLEQLGWTVVLYTLFYSLYAWIARIRNAVIVLVVFLLVVVASRVVPTLI